MTKSNSRLPFWRSVVLVALVVPGVFWLKFGRIDGVSITLTGFLLLVLFAAEYLPKLNEKYGAEQDAIKVKPRRFDMLGVVWLLAIPFAPFILWVIGSLTTVDAGNWRLILGAKAFVCVVVPVVCVLPLLRYVRGKAGPYALLIFFIGTAFPVSVGWASASDLLRGPQWEAVEISSISRMHISIQFRDHQTRQLTVHLADGRELEANSDQVTLRTGACKVLVLKAVGRIISVE